MCCWTPVSMPRWDFHGRLDAFKKWLEKGKSFLRFAVWVLFQCSWLSSHFWPPPFPLTSCPCPTSPQLTDFGLSRHTVSVSKEAGQKGGTISYMPPEAFNGPYKPTQASDIYRWLTKLHDQCRSFSKPLVNPSGSGVDARTTSPGSILYVFVTDQVSGDFSSQLRDIPVVHHHRENTIWKWVTISVPDGGIYNM